MVYCPVCGSENPEDAKECKNCGKNIENVINNLKSEEQEYNLLKISGYIFILLGLFSFGILSLVGLVLGYKTYTQNNPKAKTHGFIIILLNLVVIISWMWIILLIPNWWQSIINQPLPKFYR